jgi:dUTP pyrophosphatase
MNLDTIKIVIVDYMKKWRIKSMSQINIPIEICREGIELPQYARHGDAGMDIRAAETIEIEPYKTQVIPTGLKVAIPIGYEIQIRPRSGLSLKSDLRVANAPGTVDAGYRDEIGIIVTNTGSNYIVVSKGDRIAQMVLNEVPKINWTPVDSVASIGQNRGGGYGSTGQN